MRRLTVFLTLLLTCASAVCQGTTGSATGSATSSPSGADTRPRNKAEIVAEKIEKQVEKMRGIVLKTPVKIGVYDAATLKAFLLKSAEKELAPARLDPQVRSLKAFELVPK